MLVSALLASASLPGLIAAHVAPESVETQAALERRSMSPGSSFRSTNSDSGKLGSTSSGQRAKQCSGALPFYDSYSHKCVATKPHTHCKPPMPVLDPKTGTCIKNAPKCTPALPFWWDGTCHKFSRRRTNMYQDKNDAKRAKKGKGATTGSVADSAGKGSNHKDKTAGSGSGAGAGSGSAADDETSHGDGAMAALEKQVDPEGKATAGDKPAGPRSAAAKPGFFGRFMPSWGGKKSS